MKPSPSLPASSPRPSPSPLTTPSKPEVTAEYVIGPGDVLHVFVWKEPDVTREARVRSDGKVTIPLLGDVTASGLTAPQLAADVAKKLSQFLTAPQVTVSLTSSSSLRYFVVGEVNKPGEFPLNGRVTVLEALAAAGGFTELAKKDKILVVRRAGGAPVRVNYKDLASGKDLRGNAVLSPGDTVVVP